MRSTWPKLGLLFVSLLLSIVIVEMALERTKPLWGVFYPPVCFQPDVFEQVPFGYRLWPHLHREHRYPPGADHAVTLSANAEGFRSDHDFAAPDTRDRIVVLGDSTVFGEGVEASERFTDLLGSMEPAWRVDNLGMIGYGADLMLRSLEAVGLEPRPRAVVFAIFSDDWRRVVEPYAGVGFAIPRYRLEDGALVTVPYPRPRPWDRLRIVQGARYAYWRYTDATFPLNGAILDRFRELARQHGFAPAIVFLPGPTDGRDDQRRRSWLARYAAENTIPFLDLTDAIQSAGGVSLYLPNDPHFAPAGHVVIARELHRLLTEQVLGESTAGTTTDAAKTPPSSRPSP